MKREPTYTTAQVIVDELRRKTGDLAETSVLYMIDDSLLYRINEIKRDLFHVPFSGMSLDPQRRINVSPTGKGWDFAEKEKKFNFVVKTSIASDITEGSVGNADLSDGSSFTDEPGAFILYDNRGAWDYITYQTKPSDDVCATLGDVDTDHTSGETCERLYKLPETFECAKKLVVDEDEMYEGSEDPERDFFCIHHGFLWMPRDFGVSSGTLLFWKKPVDITELDQTLDTPVELNSVILAILEAEAYALNGENADLVSQCFFRAVDKLQSYVGFSVQTSNNRLHLARPMPRSPTQLGGSRVSSFDEGYGYN
jgi:hypothetical protein